jgi:hypothetical protein
MARYNLQIPDILFGPEGYPFINCPISAVDWSSLSWGRWGSGGEYAARHMFVDDWRLEHLWRKQGEGLAKTVLQGIVTAPDFTIENHFPAPLVSYQVWRSRVLAKFWQLEGVIVVPVLQWGSPETFKLCTCGIRSGSVVAVRGPQKGTETAWQAGFDYMITHLQPSLVLHFGRHVKYSTIPVVFFPLKPKVLTHSRDAIFPVNAARHHGEVNYLNQLNLA